MEELDTVVLTHDLKKYALKVGDVGAIVHRYSDDQTMEVEFVAASGKTVALVTLTQSDLRPMAKTEIFSVRTVAPARFA